MWVCKLVLSHAKTLEENYPDYKGIHFPDKNQAKTALNLNTTAISCGKYLDYLIIKLNVLIIKIGGKKMLATFLKFQFKCFQLYLQEEYFYLF